MRRPLLAVLSLTCLLAPLHAHGGIYKGPNDGGVGSTSGGSNGTAPTSPTGGPGSKPGVPGPGTSGDPTTGGRTGGGRTGTTGLKGALTGAGELETAWESWEFWWEANKDSFLDLRNRLAVPEGATSGATSLTGRGFTSKDRDSRRPSPDDIQGVVVPMLTGLLARATERDILDSSIVALARAGERGARRDVVGLAAGLLDSKDLSVQSAAALALGICGRAEGVPLLQELMAGTAEGRRLMGGSAVPSLVRAFAALSLGLLDDAGSVPRLIDLLDNTKDAERDVKVAAIVALGLMSGHEGDAASRWLLGRLEDRKLDAIIASYVPISLGRLGRPEAIGPLMKAFASRDTDQLVRQSVIIALGQLASLADKPVVDALVAYVHEGRDQQARHFCFMSLAQIAARDAAPYGAEDALAETRRQVGKLFADELQRPSSAGHRSWAALAAAILGRADAALRADFEPRLIGAWEREKDPSNRSAFALALGLAEVKSMGEPLFEDFRASHDQDHRGYTALALGFLRYREAAGTLRAQCAVRTQVPSFRLQVATALGLMGDADTVATLVATLQDAETLAVSSAVARALGLIGDSDAIAPLVALAQDDGRPAITRGFACVALGRLCETSDLRWNARLAANNNYRARVPAMDEVLDIQ